MTIMPLCDMVEVMYRHCLERAKGLIEVKFQHRVVGVGQGPEASWVDVEVGEEKRVERFEADYVVGCDGGSSAVRKSLYGREWPGRTFDQQIVVQNVSGYGHTYPSFPLRSGSLLVDRSGTTASRSSAGSDQITWSTLTPGVSSRSEAEMVSGG